jgi:hypothetical protein
MKTAATVLAILAILALEIAYPVAAHSQSAAAAPQKPAADPAAAAAPAAPSAPAASFGGVELGMDRDAVIAALKKNALFAYRGPEDVSLLPSPNQSLIEVAGLSYVRRGYFQFYDGKLWTMILVLDPAKVDHYSIYTTLVAKYGEPKLLDPKEARWEDQATRMALERPLSLRYMDMAVYSKLSEKSTAEASWQELERRDFLGGL